jgi:LmbE family N-acetylglucosaminyl deacetylase
MSLNQRQVVMMFTPYVIDVPLSVGGLLALHAEAGDEVFVVTMCYPGMPSRVVYPEARTPEGGLYGRFKTKENFEREVAAKEASAVSEILGIRPIITFNFEPNRDALFGHDVVDRTAAVLNEYQPDIAIAYWPISNYTDFTGCTTALTRAIAERELKKMPQVYFAETLNGRHTLCFRPDTYVDISRTLKKKRDAAGAVWEGKNLDYFFNTYSLPTSEFRGRECGAAHAEAYVSLHGGFGQRKTPESSGVRGMTMNRTTGRLERREMTPGMVPPSYGVNGVIDNPTAEKVYGKI